MADKPRLNSTYEIEGLDGETIKLTLSYKYLYQLKAKHREQYNDFNRILSSGAKDLFDNLTVLYTAYLCQRIADTGDTEGCMSFDEFMDVCPAWEDAGVAVGMLIAPKKTMASVGRS